MSLNDVYRVGFDNLDGTILAQFRWTWKRARVERWAAKLERRHALGWRVLSMKVFGPVGR